MKGDNHIIRYDLIRIILTILVVIGHSTYYSINTPFGGIDILSRMEMEGGGIRYCCS